MKNKKIFGGIICMLMLFILTGCFNKTAITTNEFKKKSEDFGLNTVDVSSQFSQNKEIIEATVAGKQNEWQIEFYVLEDKAAATSMFNTNKEKFESYKTTNSSELSKNTGNYSSYSLTSDGYYMYLCKIDNTLLYARVSNEYEAKAKELIKKLKYN